MVQFRENEVIITISHPSPTDFLGGLQTGIIEMVKSLLSVGPPERELALDAETSEGCIYALELVQATLIDPEMIEVAQELAGKVIPPPDPD
jgi:hypothetical protein